jgi:leader peptidase (prepilin peptidase)/N-methyltransferase
MFSFTGIKIFFSIVFFCYGLIAGSFLNVCIHRLPKKQSVVSPRSHCPQCNKLIAWYDNIPLLSFIMLRGKCRHCGASISYIYPLVEFTTAFFFLIMYLKWGLTFQLLIDLIFICLLLLLLFIDLLHYLLPNSITLPGIVLGFGLSFINQRISWLESLIGLLIGGGILLVISLFYSYVKKKEGMGMGDVKMLAMLGAFLGWKLCLLTLILASIIGTILGIIVILKSKEGLMKQLPFGSFLALAALITLFWGQGIISSYQGFISRLILRA